MPSPLLLVTALPGQVIGGVTGVINNTVSTAGGVLATGISTVGGVAQSTIGTVGGVANNAVGAVDHVGTELSRTDHRWDRLPNLVPVHSHCHRRRGRDNLTQTPSIFR